MRRQPWAFALFLVLAPGLLLAQDAAPTAVPDKQSTPNQPAAPAVPDVQETIRKSYERISAELERIEKERSGFPGAQGPDSRLSQAALDANSSPVLRRRREVLPLTLPEAIQMALRNDLGLQIAQEQALASALGVDIARADFDPNFDASVARSRSRRTSIFQNPITGLPSAAVTNQFDRIELSSGISQLFATGATGSVRWTQTRSETKGATNNPQVDIGVALSVSQPLLRGRGYEVTLARLRNSRLDRADAYAQLAQTIQGVILQVRQAYWALVSAEENLRVQQANFFSAVEFLRGERDRFALRAGRQLDVAIAEAAVARRLESVIQAETELENSRDALLNRIAPRPELLAWDAFIVPLDRPSFIPPPDLDLNRAVAVAFERRIDLMTAQRGIERQTRNLTVAENNLLPNLDLSISGGLAAASEKHHNAYGLFDPPEDAFNLRGGLTLRFPLFFRAERASRAQARHSLRAAELEVERRRSDAILEIRRALRTIITARERVIVNQQSVLLSERQLNTERESVGLGLTVARNLLDAQQDLANARLALQRSLIDYRESIASFEASIGVLLDKYRTELPVEVRTAMDGLVEDD